MNLIIKIISLYDISIKLDPCLISKKRHIIICNRKIIPSLKREDGAIQIFEIALKLNPLESMHT